jgi:hypothetical protein
MTRFSQRRPACETAALQYDAYARLDEAIQDFVLDGLTDTVEHRSGCFCKRCDDLVEPVQVEIT